MSTDDINTQTGTAREAITDLTPGEAVAVTVAGDSDGDGDDHDDVDFDYIVDFRIKATHVDCGGIRADCYDATVDETLLCNDEDACFFSQPLSTLTYVELNEAIYNYLDQCGDHGEAEGQRLYEVFEYVYDEEGRETQMLYGVSDDELRRIIGAGPGFINVVWYW